MKVIRAKILGYCFGARSAVNMALEAPGKYGGKKIVTYGHIIHNPVAIKQLAEAGVSLLEPPVEKIDFEGLAIIRAHGIPPATRSELVRAGWTILDATCPRIRESQKRAEAAFQDGSTVIIAGDKNHPEITGIAGYAPNAVIVENAEDAERVLPFLLRDIKEAGKKAALIGQTTMGRGEYEAIAEKLAIPGLEVHDTICPATLERQESLRELCPKVDGVLVVGGKNSANTRQLLAIAGRCCSKAALVEGPGDIPADFFSLSRVGLSAGASTPDEIIDEVEAALLRRKNEGREGAR